MSFKLIIDVQHLEKIRCLITSVIEVLNTFDTTFSNIFTTSAPSFKKHITKVFSHVSNLEKNIHHFLVEKDKVDNGEGLDEENREGKGKTRE